VRRVLDAYCCSGGAGAGYAAAGFLVTGVDIEPQPEYPFDFVQGDAVAFIREHGHEFDLIHGSPPCQGWSPLNAYNQQEYPMLIAGTREAMIASGTPYVIENVQAARSELKDPVMLCGPMFGLKMYRHRLFEASFPLDVLPDPAHRWLCSRNGYLPTAERPFMSIHGGRHSRAWQRKAAEYMGTPWITTIRGVCEAIPPAYTQCIGYQLLDGIAP
jgi:DNA (cytosine-5)-methyltransferase 1